VVLRCLRPLNASKERPGRDQGPIAPWSSTRRSTRSPRRHNAPDNRSAPSTKRASHPSPSAQLVVARWPRRKDPYAPEMPKGG